MRITAIFFIGIAGLFVQSCNILNEVADAYGNFEAQEILVSAEANGIVTEFRLEEGQPLEKGEVIGYVDTSGLTLQKDVLNARRDAVRSRSKNITAETQVLEERKKALLVEKNRVENLLKDGAATTKQLDDILQNIRILEKQIVAIKSQISNMQAELIVIDKQVDQVNDQIGKAQIKAPISGTVLEKYAEKSEMVGVGKPIFKMADLDTLILRVYISGSQLTSIRIGQKVFVYVDQNADEMVELQGTVSWISSQAEFTPKIIQTKEERVNLVYAVKILVNNDGILKIGMPGEVRFEATK
jgi:HlyD family secretion protein